MKTVKPRKEESSKELDNEGGERERETNRCSLEARSSLESVKKSEIKARDERRERQEKILMTDST